MLDLSDDPVVAIMRAWVDIKEAQRKAAGVYLPGFGDPIEAAKTLLAECKAQTAFEQEQLVNPYEYIAGVL